AARLRPDDLARPGVAEFDDVDRAIRSVSPERRSVRLASRSAPRGRALQPSDRVDVVWVLEGPCVPDGVEARRSQILALLDQAEAQGGVPTVADLAGVLEVSTATIRRDLAALRRSGHEVRTRGSSDPP
ncbi:MAG: DeoR family transcriptional regulator, partial [Acidimicrobiia bacterium]|nr:DeoR family transcriptional regulator [Acidimicrobiia bacterium]